MIGAVPHTANSSPYRFQQRMGLNEQRKARPQFFTKPRRTAQLPEPSVTISGYKGGRIKRRLNATN